MQAQRTWHCDIRPANIGVVPSAEPNQRYYLFDLGAAANPAVCTLAHQLHPGTSSMQWRRLSCYSSIRDPFFSSLEALQGSSLTSSSDIQSVVYTAVVLSGHELPWAAAASAGDRDAVVRARHALAAQPTSLPGVSAWPQELQSVAHAAVRSDANVVQAAQYALASMDAAAG